MSSAASESGSSTGISNELTTMNLFGSVIPPNVALMVTNTMKSRLVSRILFKNLIAALKPYFKEKVDIQREKPNLIGMAYKAYTNEEIKLVNTDFSDIDIYPKKDLKVKLLKLKKNALLARADQYAIRIINALFPTISMIESWKAKGEYDYTEKDVSEEDNEITGKKRPKTASAASENTSEVAINEASMEGVFGDEEEDEESPKLPNHENSRAAHPAINDSYECPVGLVKKIIKTGEELGFLKPTYTIWDCCAGTRKMADAFTNVRYKVNSTDITDKYSHDFLKDDNKKLPFYKDTDVIIANPPFKLYTEFITALNATELAYILVLPLRKLVNKGFASVMKNVRCCYAIAQPKCGFMYIGDDGIARESDNNIVVLFCNFPSMTEEEYGDTAVFKKMVFMKDQNM